MDAWMVNDESAARWTNGWMDGRMNMVMMIMIPSLMKMSMVMIIMLITIAITMITIITKSQYGNNEDDGDDENDDGDNDDDDSDDDSRRDDSVNHYGDNDRTKMFYSATAIHTNRHRCTKYKGTRKAHRNIDIRPHQD